MKFSFHISLGTIGGLLAWLGAGVNLSLSIGIAILLEMASLLYIFACVKNSDGYVYESSLLRILTWQYAASFDVYFNDIITLAVFRIISYLMIMSMLPALIAVGILFLLASFFFYSRSIF